MKLIYFCHSLLITTRVDYVFFRQIAIRLEMNTVKCFPILLFAKRLVGELLTN